MMARLYQPILAVGLVSCAAAGQLDRSKGYGGEAVQDASVEDVPVRGYMVSVEFRRGNEMKDIDGTLLAVDEEAVWLLQGDARVRIPRDSIRKVEVALYSSGAGRAGAWTAAGTLSTLSHGLFLIFTGPVWLITGISATVSAAASNDLDVGQRDLGELYQYARFPQGLPVEWR